ncbi:MAG: hypothetical protein ACPIOQ_29715, partial [Promethearchaeia archaeon]
MLREKTPGGRPRRCCLALRSAEEQTSDTPTARTSSPSRGQQAVSGGRQSLRKPRASPGLSQRPHIFTQPR